MSSKKSAGKNKTSNKNDKVKGSNVELQDTKNENELQTYCYRYLTMEQSNALLAIDNINAFEKKVFEISVKNGVFVDAQDYAVDMKVAAVLDYYVAALWWAIGRKFLVDQLSTFYSIIHVLFDNIKDKNMTLVQNLVEYKTMLAGQYAHNNAHGHSAVAAPNAPHHHVDELPSGALNPAQGTNDNTDHLGNSTKDHQATQKHVSSLIECLSLPQIDEITAYIKNVIFRHYKLYEYLFNYSQAEEIVGSDIILETPLSATMLWPPPLDEGILEPIQDRLDQLDLDNMSQSEDEKSENGDKTSNCDQENLPLQDLLEEISPERVHEIMKDVFDELLKDVKDDLAFKIRQRENSFISRINKIHKISAE